MNNSLRILFVTEPNEIPPVPNFDVGKSRSNIVMTKKYSKFQNREKSDIFTDHIFLSPQLNQINQMSNQMSHTAELQDEKDDTFYDSLKATEDFYFDNTIQTESNEAYSKDTSYYVEKISLKGAIWGKLGIRKGCLHFESENNGKRPENQNIYRFGSKNNDFIETQSKRKIWKFSEISKVFSRSFNLIDCALEIFTVNSKTYFFNIFFKEKRNNILEKLKLSNSGIEVIVNRRKAFDLSGLQEKWIKDEISNFDYLMQLNTYAGILSSYFLF